VSYNWCLVCVGGSAPKRETGCPEGLEEGRVKEHKVGPFLQCFAQNFEIASLRTPTLHGNDGVVGVSGHGGSGGWSIRPAGT
jgi:hypothetical protein